MLLDSREHQFYNRTKTEHLFERMVRLAASKLPAVAYLEISGLYAGFCQNNLPARGRPLVVYRKGRVFDRSKEAAAEGVASGMSRSQVRHLCPQAREEEYVQERFASRVREFLDLVSGFSSAVEPLTMEPLLGHQVFLDLMGCSGSDGPKREMDRLVRKAGAFGFSVRSGLASNRLLARIAAERRKAVVPGREREYLAPLPIDCLWPLEERIRSGLRRLGILTAGELARIPETELISRFGPEGALARRLSLGIDPSPVAGLYPLREITRRREFEPPVSDLIVLEAAASALAGSLARELEKAGQAALELALAVTIDGRAGDIRSVRRFGKPELRASFLAASALAPFRGLLGAAPESGKTIGVTGLVLTVRDLRSARVDQLDFFNERSGRDPQKLAEVVEAIKKRYPGERIRLGMGPDYRNAAGRRELMLSLIDPWRRNGQDH